MTVKQDVLDRWTVENATETYGVRNWSGGHFEIGPDGKVAAMLQCGDGRTRVPIYDLIQELKASGIYSPVLLRFSDIVRSRIEHLHGAFSKAIQDLGYRGAYQGVYPIKVNQHQEVVSDVVTYGGPYRYGLEAGSKAELIVAVGHLTDPQTLLICNGYKDEEFIDYALYATKMGINVHIVIEMPGELALVLDRAQRLRVTPKLGIRARLSSRAGGHWDGSGGDRSKFGLDPAQVLAVVDRLKELGQQDCLRLLHYHLGSQVPDIRRIRTAANEAARFYAELVREGVTMGILDVGGGLAVDYDGSHTNFASSCNYSSAEYAADVLEAVMHVLDESNTPHPTIVTEAGRATVAHHAVLVFNVLDAKRYESGELPESLPEDTSEDLRNLFDCHRSVSTRNVQEIFHDLVFYRDAVRNRFLHGVATLRERALAETLFWHTIRRIATLIGDAKYIPDEMEGLDAVLADQFFGNFSVFQSLPDTWAVDQLFPVMPIHRLDTRPTRQGVVADITCDSDGKLDRFTDLHDVRRSLPLHEPGDQEYYLAVFLVGAYQETLGDMHNLFGDVNSVQIRMNDEGVAEIVKRAYGDTVDEILRYVEYDTDRLLASITTSAERARKAGLMSDADCAACITAFRAGLRGYTYFEQ